MPNGKKDGNEYPTRKNWFGKFIINFRCHFFQFFFSFPFFFLSLADSSFCLIDMKLCVHALHRIYMQIHMNIMASALDMIPIWYSLVSFKSFFLSFNCRILKFNSYDDMTHLRHRSDIIGGIAIGNWTILSIKSAMKAVKKIDTFLSMKWRMNQ